MKNLRISLSKTVAKNLEGALTELATVAKVHKMRSNARKYINMRDNNVIASLSVKRCS